MDNTKLQKLSSKYTGKAFLPNTTQKVVAEVFIKRTIYSTMSAIDKGQYQTIKVNMEINETSLGTISKDILLNNPDYFKYIFKKTEKIACAVFYILRHSEITETDTVLVSEIKASAKSLLSLSLQTLRANAQTSAMLINDLKFKVLEIESNLRVACASNLISEDTLAVFLNETDSVLRTIKKFLSTESNWSLTETTTSTAQSGTANTKKKATRIALPSEGVPHSDPVLPRRERILSVVREKGEATIKDICEVIKDCSEKTVQRDLISLIKDNLVSRSGERRWSKYSPV